MDPRTHVPSASSSSGSEVGSSSSSSDKNLPLQTWDPQLKMAPAEVLINRSVKVEDEKELWFVLNGVSVRYSIIEHILISGLKCGEYPEEWESFKKSEFRKKDFRT
ncbi:PREDICTED: uncharacterized protein LOC104827496 [Tarenaya hassleriana]|uniref:uncharacterized protein LOC104827496 n=1 Tax=Tarenaya hassleriana TaxID=28532 RepID=UPI00053C2344|nr:PREDICTED: uncharacterized protein LOC104827496 [Tarenaya hassleriana]